MDQEKPQSVQSVQREERNVRRVVPSADKNKNPVSTAEEIYFAIDLPREKNDPLTQRLYARSWIIGAITSDKTWVCQGCWKTSPREDVVCAASGCKGVNPISFMDFLNERKISIDHKELAGVLEVSGVEQNIAIHEKSNWSKGLLNVYNVFKQKTRKQ